MVFVLFNFFRFYYIGWLQVIEKNGKKRHRYYVLCPTYLAYFASEEHAAISEEGFMQGDADYNSISSFGSTGAQVLLSNVYSCEPDPLGEPTFLITYRKPLDDGTNAMQLACANKEIAKGWSDAIMGQTANHTSITVPSRTKAAVGPTVEDMAREAATKAAIAAMKGMRNLANETKKGGLSGLMNGLAVSLTGWGGNSNAEPIRQDSEYIVYCPWDERGIDLQSKAGKTCLEDELGHPAAIMHGWLTKKNKSGLRVGHGEKERYFVLTPLALTFFPDERVAAVKDGYLYGKAVGERIGGLFEKTGAFLPLESVCEIKLLARLDESNQMRRLNSSSSMRSNSSRRDSDDEEDEESPRKPAPKSKPKKKKADSDEEEDSDDDRKKKKANPKKKKADSDEEEEEEDSDDDRKKKKTKPKKKKADSDEEEEEEDSDDDRKKKKAKPKKKKADSDEEEEEEEKPSKSKPKGEKPSAPKPTSARPSGKPSGEKPKPLSGSSNASSSTSSTTSTLRPEGPPPSNLIEIDFGEFSLIVNAHNPKNRTAWVNALRKWSGWRKRNVDEEMLANFGGI